MNAIADNAPQQPNNAAAARLTCVMCGGDNALDATQCEHCGAALQPSIATASPRAASTRAAAETVAPQPIERAATGSDSARAATPPAEKSVPVTFDFAPLAAPLAGENPASATENSVASPQTKNVEVASKSAAALPTEIASTRDASALPSARGADASEEVRAQNLLDRAFRFSEIGDIDAAILAVSEAAILQPGSAAPPSMLALLLERIGDTAGAIKAYRRALKVAPDHRAARDSLARLQAATEILPVADASQTSAASPPESTADVFQAAREYSQNAADALSQTAASATAEKAAPLETVIVPDAAARATENVAAASSPSATGAAANANITTVTAAPATAKTSSVMTDAAARTTNAIAPASALSATPSAFASASDTAGAASTRNPADLESATQNDISALSEFLQDISAPGTTAATHIAPDVARPFDSLNEMNAPGTAWRESYFLRSLPLAATALLGIWFLLASRTAPKTASTRIIPVSATPTAAPPVSAATEAAPPQNQSVQEQLAAAVAAAQKTVAPTAPPFVNAAPGAPPTAAITPTASATPFTPPILPPATTGTVSPTVGSAPILPPQNATPAGDSSHFERASQLQQRALASLETGDNAAAARGFTSAIEAYDAQIATGFRIDEARAAIAACRDGIQLAQQMQSRAAPPR